MTDMDKEIINNLAQLSKSLEKQNQELFEILKGIISDENILWKYRKPYYDRFIILIKLK